MRAIVHVDLDAFFVSVELLDRPELRGRPVVVGGRGARGVVAAASYEARAYGVHSAMPSLRAQRLCPHAVFLPGRYERYREASAAVFAVFRSVSPLVEGLSLDEAFLDVTGTRRLLGDPPAVAAHLRAAVLAETGLACSVGVAPRKLTAKLASEAAKPSASTGGPVPGAGVVVVEAHEELAFLHGHPVGALWGVGPATRSRLDRLGVRTIGELAAVPLDALAASLGPGPARHLHDLAWGRDERPVVPDVAAKSVGHEETFAVDHHGLATLGPELVRLGDAVAGRLRGAGVAGRTVQLKVRFAGFRTVTRSVTVPEPVDRGGQLVALTRPLLESLDLAAGVRLLGLSVSGLRPAEVRQLSLDDALRPGWSGATEAVDAVRARFGDGAIAPASVVARGRKRRGEQQWGPA